MRTKAGRIDVGVRLKEKERQRESGGENWRDIEVGGNIIQNWKLSDFFSFLFTNAPRHSNSKIYHFNSKINYP